MKRKYETHIEDDDDERNNKRIRSTTTTSIVVEQPDTCHFDTNTREYWNCIVHLVRTHVELYLELCTFLTYLENKSTVLKEQLREQLEQLQLDNDKNAYYYVVQYGIMRLDEDKYGRERMEQITNKLMLLSTEDKGNVWISNLYLMFLLRLGYLYAHFDESDKMLACCETVSNIFPNFDGIDCYRAANLFTIGRFEESLAYFDKAIELFPQNSGLYRNRAFAKYSLDRFDEAMVDYDRAIAINPNHIRSIYGKGGLYAILGQFDLAIDYFTKVLVLNPDHRSARRSRAVVYCNIDLYIPALRDFRQISYTTGKTERTESLLRAIMFGGEDQLFTEQIV
jgi:tetratricopeptide (TPR) repeat protein